MLRFSQLGSCRGAENMCRDRALWQWAEANPFADPWLAVYGWTRPTLSLGYHQSPQSLDLRVAHARGWDVVRRPTGGSAVLHHEEITYCVVSRFDLVPGFGKDVSEVYTSLADALVRSLRALGVAASRAGEGRPEAVACFGSSMGHEIVVNERKLLGSALRRGRHAFLMHGSLLVGPGHVELAEALGPHRGAWRTRLQAATTHLRELNAAAIVDSFGVTLARELATAIGAEEQEDELPRAVLEATRAGVSRGLGRVDRESERQSRSHRQGHALGVRGEETAMVGRGDVDSEPGQP